MSAYQQLWLVQRKSLLEAFRKLTSDKKKESYWEPVVGYVEEQLKEEDSEKTHLIYEQLVRLCRNPRNGATTLKLLERLLPCSRLLRQLMLDPLEPCLIQLVESGSTEACQYLSRWDEYYGNQFPSLQAFVRRFVGKSTFEPSAEKPTNPPVDCGIEEDISCVVKQLRECLGLIVPLVNDKWTETAADNKKPIALEEPKDITIQLVTDVSLLENEENRIVFDSCRELLRQLEKMYSRMKQMSEDRKEWMNQVDSLLQHCYQLGLRSKRNQAWSCSDHTTSEDEDSSDIVWETVVYDVDTEENNKQETQFESSTNEYNNDQWKQIEKQPITCNEDILQQLETAVPYPKQTDRKHIHVQSSYSNETILQEKCGETRKRKETSKQRISRLLKRSASKVSKTWNGMQEREDLERYHQTFANSVTVGRID